MSAGKSTTIVIPTLGREILVKTLRSLVSVLPATGVDILVLGKILNPDVKDEVMKLVAEHSNIIHKEIHFEDGDLSRKKNAGYEENQSELIIFIDDDLIVTDGWYESILEPFKDSDVGMVCGPSLLPEDLTRMARLAGVALSSWASGFVAHRYIRGDEATRDVDWSEMIGCNMACRKSVLKEIGGFNTTIIPGEDLLAAYDVLSRGYRLVFQPQACVYHYPRQSLRGFCRQAYRFGLARIRMFRYGVNIQPITLLPGLWIGVTAVLCVGSLFWIEPLLGLIVFESVYLVFALLASFNSVLRSRRPSDMIVFPLIPVMHACYGIGEWVELLRPGRSVDEKPVSTGRDERTTNNVS